LEGKTNVGPKNRENKEKADKEKDANKKGDIERETIRVVDGASLDNLLQRLPRCVSRDLIDQLTVITTALCTSVHLRWFCRILRTSFILFFQVEFCYLNSKANRKKLARALYNVPRTSLELLPYYSRLVATLSTCMKDLPSMLLPMLEEEFNSLINKKVWLLFLYIFILVCPWDTILILVKKVSFGHFNFCTLFL
jgi:regulator of nonsense transcripts 2